MADTRKRVLGEYLVLCAQDGDRAALGQLVRLWQGDLLRHARRLSDDAEEARDILQESWLDIVRGLNRLNAPAAFPAWAYRIVSRKAAARVKTRQGERRLSQDLTAELAEARIEGEAEAEVRSDLAAVRRAMTHLPEAQRITLALHHQDGLTVSEISVVLGVPSGTVKTRLMHARRKLAAQLDPHQEGEGYDTINR
ncbi:RNA polymerase sigma factor [Maricaulis parjimensis]|uniref:RNA polymerase sigma factor n=1 Tax=Maricaulis parjimensis TaxID=144023 RepID=UPI001939F382|nr:sigma-70 family RNA polymerase sigma factor [Maricaulis parjimensis]